MKVKELTNKEIAIKALKRLNRFQKTFDKTVMEIQRDVSKVVEGGVLLVPPTDESGGGFTFCKYDMSDYNLVEIINPNSLIALLKDLEDGKLIDGDELFSY